MRINITSGECLNEILVDKYPNEIFIPFNEAMIKGTYKSELFSEEFMIERSKVHSVCIDEYKHKLQGFLNILNDPNAYDEIYLYFGDEPFCLENRRIVIESLNKYGFKGKIISLIVDEITGNVIKMV